MVVEPFRKLYICYFVASRGGPGDCSWLRDGAAGAPLRKVSIFATVQYVFVFEIFKMSVNIENFY